MGAVKDGGEKILLPPCALEDTNARGEKEAELLPIREPADQVTSAGAGRSVSPCQALPQKPQQGCRQQDAG